MRCSDPWVFKYPPLALSRICYAIVMQFPFTLPHRCISTVPPWLSSSCALLRNTTIRVANIYASVDAPVQIFGSPLWVGI